MIVPDVNVLVYAADSSSRHHEVARSWWEQTLTSGEPVGLPWVVSTGFLRVVTHPGIVASPYAATDALDIVDGWLGRASVLAIGPGRGHAALLRRFLSVERAGGNHVPDAHIAAIVVEHDATLWSSDRGFARFDGLQWRDPIASTSP